MDNCDQIVISGLNYCMAHKCKITCCRNHWINKNGGCKYHTCGYATCKNIVVTHGADACIDHKCLLLGCFKLSDQKNICTQHSEQYDKLLEKYISVDIIENFLMGYITA